MEKVLVTGASGYIALHCISKLLKVGYAVKGSLRDMSREIEVRDSVTKDVASYQLEFCELDLMNDEGWEKHTEDCDYILHLASPFFLQVPKNENELISPAELGTIRAMKAAKKNNLKKIIIISSMAAVAYGDKEKHIYNENDWSNVDLDIGAYRKSKTIAEKVAWEYIHNQDTNNLKLTTILPGFVFGPTLNNDKDSTSVNMMKKIMNGENKGLPEYLSIADVRDVAELLVKSIDSKKSDGKRLLATSPKSLHISKISHLLHKNGFLIPNFDNIKIEESEGGYNADISPVLSIFDWEQTPLEKTILDMAEKIKKYN